MPDNTMALMLQAQALSNANQNAVDAINKGRTDALGRYKINYLDPYSTAGGKGLDMSVDALGLNGPEGNDAATSAFRTSPGYQFAMDQGLQGLERAAAARGMLGSGNLTGDILKFSQGLADQEFGNWRSGVGRLADLGFNAATGQTGRQGALAGIDMNAANNAASTWNNYGSNLASVFQPQQQQPQRSGLGSAIAGGLNLAGGVLGGSSGGGLSTTPEALRAYNGQAEWNPWR